MKICLRVQRKKIQSKGCDYIIANDISRKDIGFNVDENEVYIVNKNLEVTKFDKDTKSNIAYKILGFLSKELSLNETLKV